MEIQNSSMEDMEEIFRLYAIATEYMKSKGMVHWPAFEPSLVETEFTSSGYR